MRQFVHLLPRRPFSPLSSILFALFLAWGCGGGEDTRGSATTRTSTTSSLSSTQTAGISSEAPTSGQTTVSGGSTVLSGGSGTTAVSSDTGGTAQSAVEPPEILSTPPGEAYPGFPYEYLPEVRSSTPVTWAFCGDVPEGMTIAPQEGRVTWTPPPETLGSCFALCIEAANEGGSDTQAFDLCVVEAAPHIVSTPVTGAAIGRPYEYLPRATGLPPLTWRLDAGPEGMTIDPAGGAISWTPTAEDAGEHEVRLAVTNEVGEDVQRFTLAVGEGPEFLSTAPTAAIVGGRYTYRVEVSGAEPITLSLLDPPVGLQLDPQTREVTWIPAEGGAFSVEIAAENPFGTVTQRFTIEVLPLDAAEIDVAQSSVTFDPSCLVHDGSATTTVTVIPRDARGALFPPGLVVSIETDAGTMLGEVADHGDGTYSRVLQAAEGPFTARLDVEVAKPGEAPVRIEPAPEITSTAPADPTGGMGGCPLDGRISVTVLDRRNGFGIEEAFVMIGDAPGSPFSGNIGFTDEEGRILFTADALSGKTTVTAWAPGFQIGTLFSVGADHVVLPLSPEAVPERFDVAGSLSGYRDPDTPADLYVGLVTQRLSIDDVMGFSSFTFFAPNQDVVVPFPCPGRTETALPGNIVIPPQSYLGCSWNVPYRLRLPAGETEIAVMSGPFRVLDVADILDTADPIELINAILNAFTPVNAGIRRGVSVVDDLSGVNVDVGTAISPTLRVEVANAPQELQVYVEPLMHTPQGDAYYPTDVAAFSGGEGMATLATPAASGTFAGLHYGVVASASDFTRSFPVVTMLQRDLPGRDAQVRLDTFLKVIEGMRFEGGRFHYESVENTEISPPSPVPVVAHATIRTRSDDLPLWELVMPADLRSFTLPRLPQPGEIEGEVPEGLSSGTDYRWRLRVSAFGDAPFSYDHFAFRDDRRLVTHATHNELIFTLP